MGWRLIDTVLQSNYRPGLTTRLVLLIAAHRIPDETLVGHLNTVKMTKEAQLARSTIHRAINKLKGDGIVEITERIVGRPVKYRFNREKLETWSEDDLSPLSLHPPVSLGETPPVAPEETPLSLLAIHYTEETEEEQKEEQKPDAGASAEDSLDSVSLHKLQSVAETGVLNHPQAFFDSIPPSIKEMIMAGVLENVAKAQAKAKASMPSTLLGQLKKVWRTEMLEKFPHLSPLPPLTKKEEAYLKAFARRNPDQPLVVLADVIAEWFSFRQYCQDTLGITIYGEVPKLGMLAKHADEVRMWYNQKKEPTEPSPKKEGGLFDPKIHKW